MTGYVRFHTMEQRLADKFEVGSPDQCWEWKGRLDRKGYGQVTVPNPPGRYVTAMAHRVVYEMLAGPIPAGLELDHLCRNRSCVNPSHLEPVTHAENVRRGIASEVARQRYAQRTHCRAGHEYTATNLIITKRGARLCRTCERERARLRYQAGDAGDAFYKKRAARLGHLVPSSPRSTTGVSTENAGQAEPASFGTGRSPQIRDSAAARSEDSFTDHGAACTGDHQKDATGPGTIRGQVA